MSSGKVKCTCGWSWNKSDSSKKDMYICHECGRDNSNNMKNGGWLDNYGEEANANDGSSSAPDNWTGDGYSNVGRNYSPAWGGQFQMGGSVYPVNYVPKAQTGLPINPIAPLASLVVDKVKNWFSDDKKPVKKQPVKVAPVKPNTRTLNIVDPRKKMMTNNQLIRPNVDLLTGDYTSFHLDKLIQEAKWQGLSKEDILNLSAMGFQETKWGRTDGNIGHVKHSFDDPGSLNEYEDFVNAYKAKMKEADRLGITDPAMRLQVYNGMGTITPNTEKNYHGFKMKKIYGVPVPPEGISMKKNPLYGKQILDVRDNVLAKNPEYVKYIDSIYKAPLPKYMQEQARMNKQTPPNNIQQGRPQLAQPQLPPLNKKEMGGFIPKAEDGIETTTQETTIFPNGKAFLSKLKAEAAAKKKNIPVRETPSPTVRDATATKKVKVDKPVKEYEPENMYDPSIPEEVRNQISYAKYKDEPKQNFGIIDKNGNVMYYVNPDGEIIGHENIVTGATNKDKEHAPSMLEYGKTANEYYDYLKNTNQRVTPAGSFTLYSNKNDSYGQPHSLWDRALGALPFVDDVNLNTLDDPSLLHAAYNEMPWREEEKKEYYDHRKESYGPTGNMFRMVSQYGVPSSKGIHGTGNPNRITALNTPSANKNLSNGCINVGGKTMCFDMLKDKSKLYVLPEEKDKYGEKQDYVPHKTVKYEPFIHVDDNGKWVDEEDDKLSREDIRRGKATRAKIADIIKKNKIDASPEEIDFAAAVALKETKGGESWLSSAESTLPGFSSYGLYEQKESFPYLKGKSPNDDAAATQAVIDFYRDMMRKHPNLEYDGYANEEMYSTYNSGSEDWSKGIHHGSGFRKALQSVKEYEMGGSIPQAQDGKLTFLQPTSDKLPQGYRIPYDTPSSERAMSIGGEDGEPAYLIPSFKYGQPLDDPMGEFRKTGEHLGGPFKTWQEADEWERTVRHPAVEKGENIMFPQEQFQNGGKKKPIYVESKKDPRYKAYQDSLYYHNATKDLYTSIKNANGKNLTPKQREELFQKYRDSDSKIYTKDISNDRWVYDKDGMATGHIIGKDIQPIRRGSLDLKGDFRYGAVGEIPFSYYKEPEQQIIVKEQEKRQPIKAIQNNLRPEGLVYGNTDLNSTLPTIRPAARNAKSYKVKETVQGKYAPSTVEYEVTDPRNINMNDLGPGNTRVVTPEYAMGGSIPGAVGFSYARTQSPAPSNGPYAKKTLASAKNGGWLSKYDVAKDGVETTTDETTTPILGNAPVGNKWLGNKLNSEGYITSTTKGGNRISFTGNQRADEWINKQVDSGKFGFDPVTGGTFPLKKPVKGRSKEDQFIGSEAYYNLQAPEGFNTESQLTEIKKLPTWQQDVINDSNEKRRKVYLRDNTEEVYNNPLMYAPGAVALGGLGAVGLEAAGVAAAPYIQGALATQLPGLASVPGATVGNAITAGFAGHGLAHVAPDTQELIENPSWSNAGAVGMDVLEIAPIVGPAYKMAAETASGLRNVRTSIAPELRQGVNTNGFLDMFRSKNPVVSPIENTIQPAMPKTWEMENLPGLHLQSTMENGAISRIVEPKTGLVNTKQALAIIGKESGGADKVALIKQALGENIPKKIDYNEFRKVVQDQLIPLETNFAEHASTYGLGKIGYPSPKRSTYEAAINNTNQDIQNYTNKINELKSNPANASMLPEYQTRLDEAYAQLAKNQEGLNNLPLENKTLLFSNEGKFGRGSHAHDNPDNTLGHAHYLVDAETPDILTVTQIQSDAFQGSNRIMPKDLESAQRSLSRMMEHEEALKNTYFNAKAAPEKGLDIYGEPRWYELPDGTLVSQEQMEIGASSQTRLNQLSKAEIENYSQKVLLDKNHQERYLQEIVNHAAERGNINKVRVPTSDTAANVQGYVKEYGTMSLMDRKYAETLDKLKTEGKSANEALDEMSKLWNAKPTPDEAKEFIKVYNTNISGKYSSEHQTILKKYSELPKTIKKLFGQDAKIVTDSKGNTWYEFDIPKSYKEGKGEIKAFKQGGIVKGDQDGYRNPKNRGKVVEILGDTMGTDGYDDTLYVVPDVGEPRIVYANTGNHTFPGATKFTEYPMAKNGMRQEQKGLVNLDQLTNFTNYNKPQPGGWLNKYN